MKVMHRQVTSELHKKLDNKNLKATLGKVEIERENMESTCIDTKGTKDYGEISA